MLIVSNKYRLAAVLVPKCASTTIISAFATLHDLPSSAGNRKVVGYIPRAKGKIDRKSDLITLETRRLGEARAEFGDYCWFSVIRDPYGRLLSNYHNKINRFCATFRKDLYFRYKLVQAAKGPQAWRDVRMAMPYLRSRVSYNEFVGTLSRNGVNWDRHYMQQADLLQLGKVSYTRLLRLESFRDEMTALFHDAGLPRNEVDRVGDLGWLNKSRREAMYGTLEEMAERPVIRDLYKRDFARLGYAT